MSISRRKFLTAGALLAVSAGMPLNVFADQASKGSNSSADSLLGGLGSRLAPSLGSETFARHLHTKFSARNEQGEVQLTLVEVRHWQSGKTKSPQQAGRECFSLLFKGSGSQALPQNTYRVTHASLGEFSLFVVPMTVNSRGAYYEALFNRLH